MEQNRLEEAEGRESRQTKLQFILLKTEKMHTAQRLSLLLSVILLLTACNTSQKVLYLQDAKVNTPEKIENSQVIKIEPKDMLSIVVSSNDPQVAKIFNLPVTATQAGTDRPSYGNYLIGYVVDNDGYIDFPILGKIKAAGLSRWQLQEHISKSLEEKKMLNDGLVTVEFMNFKVSILGEVTNPGTYTINSDKVTVLEAIAMAKDLTIFGERDHVYVIREENGQRKSYQLDLRSADIFKSPAYYLKQNDVIYVQPNSVKAGQSTINQNAMKSVSLWISIASLLTSIGVLIVNIAKD